MRITPKLCLCGFVVLLVVYVPFMVDTILHASPVEPKEDAADLLRAATIVDTALRGNAANVEREAAVRSQVKMNEPPKMVRDTIVIDVKEGRIRMALLPEYAPKHCKNFADLVDRGLYKDAIFYRGEPNFGLQMGPVTLSGERRPSPFSNVPLEYGVLHKFGGVNAARWDDPNSASTDFFILLGDAPHLDKNEQSPGYTVWAWVVEGIELAKALSERPAKQEPGMRMLADPPVALRVFVERDWPVPPSVQHLLDVQVDPSIPKKRIA